MKALAPDARSIYTVVTLHQTGVAAHDERNDFMQIILRTQDGRAVQNPALVPPPPPRPDPSYMAFVSGAGSCAGSVFLNVLLHSSEAFHG